ncbi:MAG: outer membrane protein transport protein [Gammaproteobacteria bacterium]|nr:outer membrane protein transport protein [Gammaproteobacteria bacterium]
MKSRLVLSLLATAGVIVSGPAAATNGYFSHGYGIKAKGMAGVGIALPQDALAAATNPAGMVLVGDRIDVGADWFAPNRGATAPPLGAIEGNGVSGFLIPEFGYNRALNADSSLGVSVYGNGGMNTEYAITPFGPPGSGKGGMNMSQLFIAPTYALQLNDQHAVGVALNLAYQQFKAYGLQGFMGMSATPSAVTNNSYDTSTGWGLRVGWTGQLTPDLTVGATYQSITQMSTFDKYAGLFAEQGGFDIPSNYGLGVSYKINAATTVAADVQAIQYSDVASVNNPMISPGQLGDANGPGFGWQDMTVIKLALTHQYDNGLLLRAGYSTNEQPIPSDETMFNVIAPGVVQDHLTLGATWTLANQAELSVSYMHAFEHKVTGSGAAAGYDLHMYEDSIGVAYGWKL